jgi:hypothetical protein
VQLVINWFPALSMFLLGLAAGRIGLLTDPARHIRLWRSCVIVGVFVGLPAGVTSAWLALVPEDPNGVYGTMGVPSVDNVPGGRRYHTLSFDPIMNHLVVFGGDAVDSQGQFGYMNDLWLFNWQLQQWVWLNGSSTASGQKLKSSLASS